MTLASHTIIYYFVLSSNTTTFVFKLFYFVLFNKIKNDNVWLHDNGFGHILIRFVTFIFYECASPGSLHAVVSPHHAVLLNTALNALTIAVYKPSIIDREIGGLLYKLG